LFLAAHYVNVDRAQLNIRSLLACLGQAPIQSERSPLRAQTTFTQPQPCCSKKPYVPSNSQYSMPSVPPHLKRPLFLPCELARKPPTNPEFCIKKSTSRSWNKTPLSLPIFPLTSSILDLLSHISPTADPLAPDVTRLAHTRRHSYTPPPSSLDPPVLSKEADA
jgi:hypothetical protein